MMDLFPAIHYVITTRPGAIDDGMFTELDFNVSDLQSMTPAQVRRFIGQWHLATLDWQVGEQERERTAFFERRLLNRIENDRFLRDLADTPLLAGLICALNLNLRAVLPSRRGEIYEKALTMFDQRDRARGISSEVSVDLAASNHLLGDLALWMVRNEVAEVPLELAQRVIARSSVSLPNGPYDEISLCRHLVLRSGLLREPTAGKIDFVHKSFQEFLAAKALIAADNVGELVRNANEDQWEQVLILSAGQGNKRQTSDLLLGLLRRATTGRLLRRMRLLAAACIGEVRGAEPEAFAALNHAITKLLPPRSIAEAETLSTAGESIIASLAKLKRSDPAENAAIIRTAALVGGTAAMKIIANIAERHQFNEGEGIGTYIEPGDVYSELMRAWEYFDPETYASTVLVATDLDALTLQDMDLIRYVPLLPATANVTIETSDGILDLTPLDILPDLQTITIFGCNSESLDNILRDWPSIWEVHLTGWDRLRDISTLTIYNNLQALHICYCPELYEYSVIGRLSSLKSLWLQGQENLDLSFISGLDSLRDLTICEAGVVDLRPLADSEMDITVFDDTPVTDLAGIDFRPNLRVVPRTPRG